MDQPSLEHRLLQAETYLAIERILRSVRQRMEARFEAEKLSDITCNKKTATNILSSGTTYDRKIYKHTYIQAECCADINAPKGSGPNQSDCELKELGQSYLQEECCREGCRLEEIHESCGAWRWDRRESFEELM